MNLKDWIKSQGLRVQDAATELEIHSTHLSDILSFQSGKSDRKKGVSLELAARIESYTAGAVTTDDILFPRGKAPWKVQRVGRVLVHTDGVKLETSAASAAAEETGS